MSYRKGTSKHCIQWQCKRDSRYGPPVDFFPFPKACLAVRRRLIYPDKKHLEECSLCNKCKNWLLTCGRIDLDLYKVTKHTYICEIHYQIASKSAEMTISKRVGEEDQFEIPSKRAKIEENDRPELNDRSVLDDSSRSKISGLDPLGDTALASGLDDSFVEHHIETVWLDPKPTYRHFSTQTDQFVKNYASSSTQTNIFIAKNDCSTQTDNVNANGEIIKYVTAGSQTTFLFKDTELLKEEKLELQKRITVQKHLIKNLEKAKNQQTENISNFVESLRLNDKKCKFYTNLLFSQLLALFNFLSPVTDVNYSGSKSVSATRRKRLTPFEALVITLVRLKTGLLIQDLSYRFNISQGLISQVFITWIQHAYSKFNIIRRDMFASREIIQEHLPNIFKRLKNIRIIIDSAEFSCEGPGKIAQQGNSSFYKRATTTFKVLLGCTPNGAISFVSDVFEGSISDKEMVEKSNLLDWLEEGDLMLANRDFDIKHLTDKRNVFLSNSSFLKGRKRFTVVGRLKQFRLLKKVLPVKMRGMLSQLVFVCCCIINFQEPPLIET